MTKINHYENWMKKLGRHNQIVMLDFSCWLGDRDVQNLLAGKLDWEEQISLYMEEAGHEKLSQIVQDHQEK